MPNETGSVNRDGSGCDFDCVDLRGVSVFGGGGAGGLWGLHSDVWGVPYACASGGRKLGAAHGGFDAGC